MPCLARQVTRLDRIRSPGKSSGRSSGGRVGHRSSLLDPLSGRRIFWWAKPTCRGRLWAYSVGTQGYPCLTTRARDLDKVQFQLPRDPAHLCVRPEKASTHFWWLAGIDLVLLPICQTSWWTSKDSAKKTRGSTLSFRSTESSSSSPAPGKITQARWQ
jgi:hypothetical protein